MDECDCCYVYFMRRIMALLTTSEGFCTQDLCYDQNGNEISHHTGQQYTTSHYPVAIHTMLMLLSFFILFMIYLYYMLRPYARGLVYKERYFGGGNREPDLST